MHHSVRGKQRSEDHRGQTAGGRDQASHTELLSYCVTALLRWCADSGLGIVATIGVTGIFFLDLLITANWIVGEG